MPESYSLFLVTLFTNMEQLQMKWMTSQQLIIANFIRFYCFVLILFFNIKRNSAKLKLFGIWNNCKNKVKECLNSSLAKEKMDKALCTEWSLFEFDAMATHWVGSIRVKSDTSKIQDQIFLHKARI